jgi:hypothetical protein
VKLYKERKTGVCNGPSSGRSSTVKSVEVKEQINQRIRDNLRISNDKTASEMRISVGTNLCKGDLKEN